MCDGTELWLRRTLEVKFHECESSQLSEIAIFREIGLTINVENRIREEGELNCKPAATASLATCVCDRGSNPSGEWKGLGAFAPHLTPKKHSTSGNNELLEEMIQIELFVPVLTKYR
ncbi:hypothetical protein TNCV_228701 [Trichonephila clavipes]|nr:hypothetical protein TNCV_228701 [Trichonephila clavipes]